MGNLIHIAEVAFLLFAAYSVGWLGGYALRRATAASRKPAQIPAERLAAVIGQSVDSDALVNAPVIVEVSRGSPEISVPTSPVTIGAVEPVSVDAAQTLSSSTPGIQSLSGFEALKSLSQRIPLVPVGEPMVQAPLLLKSEADVPASAVGTMADLPKLPVADAALDTLAASPAAPSADVSAVALTVGPLPVATGEMPPAAPDSNEGRVTIASASSVPDGAVVPPMPASVAGQARAGRRHGEGSPAAREAGGAVTPVEPAPDAAPDAASLAESAVGAALLATLEARLAIETALAAASEATKHPALPEGLPAAEHLGPAAEPPTHPTAGEPLNVPSPADAEDRLSPRTEAPDAAGVLQQSPLDPVVSGLPVDAEPLPTPGLVELPESLASVVAAVLEPEKAVAVEPTAVAAAPALEPTAQIDEGAAMRAIEGGWSRRDTRALSGLPELSDVTAAVRAAQLAVENVLAQSLGADGPPAGLGKPVGFPRARDGVRDDLKKINGLSPLDESTLNNLGVFHFDQIAAWQQTEVLWLENHVFARGRIGREDWQRQARAIAASGTLRATR